MTNSEPSLSQPPGGSFDPLRPSPSLTLAEWGRRVRANREQVDQYREEPDGPDFYAPLASNFRADPRRTDDSVVNALRGLVRPGETWLDIGAGGGRYCLPIALSAKELIAVEPSDGMLAVLRETMAENAIQNVHIVQTRWPTSENIQADTALISQVGYDIEEIGPFLDAMENAAGRCVAVMFDRQPTSAIDQIWPRVHGVARAQLPALREFLVLLLSRGKLFELRMLEGHPQAYDSPERILNFARRQTWVRPGSEKDQKLQAVIGERLTERNGRFALNWEPLRTAIVTWAGNRT